jgi:tRNA threonylcarbamoyladenosine biosynthesis protein TsaB
MPILAIETSTKQLGVTVSDSGRPLASYELLANYPHAVELPGAVTRVLKEARLTRSDIEAIAVDIGPGSFTGLRIGLAFAKALAFPAKTALIGVPSMDVLVASLPFVDRPICPILDARQHNVYAALYRLQGGRPSRATDFFLGPIDQFLASLPPSVAFLGDGCALYRERLRERCPQALFAEAELWLPRSATLARLGEERFRAGKLDDPARLVPLYLYPLDCSVRGPNRPTSTLPPQKAPDVLPATKIV